MPITLSDQEILSITDWLPRHLSSPAPDALDRLKGEALGARRRLFVPDALHLVALEPLYLMHKASSDRGAAPGIPLAACATVRELQLLLMVEVHGGGPEFTDGLWRLTDLGVQVCERHLDKFVRDARRST